MIAQEHSEALASIVQMVFAEACGKETYQIEWSDATIFGPFVRGSINILGLTPATVELWLPIPLVSVCAVRMLADIGIPTDEQFDDLVGELANMVGGNLKPILGESLQLGFPTVDHHDAGPTPTPDDLVVRADDHSVVIRLIEH
jgi:hypothetical protein